MGPTAEDTRPDWSIQDIARIAGTTSRTLRHYHRIGLLQPSRVGSNGYRYYDGAALLQLQRILLLRELGLGLPAIAEVFQHQTDPVQALGRHLEWLRQEQDRLARQILSVRQTIETVKGGGELMAEEMFNGFDHTQYKDEVEERWGRDAYAKSDSWWRGMTDAEKRAWKVRMEKLGADWLDAARSGIAPGSPDAQDVRTAANPARGQPTAASKPMCWGWLKCTWRMRGSQRIMVATPEPASCATHSPSTRKATCRRCRFHWPATGTTQSGEGRYPGHGPAHEERIDLVAALVGVEDFGVPEELAHLVVTGDAIAAEQ